MNVRSQSRIGRLWEQLVQRLSGENKLANLGTLKTKQNKTCDSSCQGKECLKIWGAEEKNKFCNTCKPQDKDFGIGFGYNELEILGVFLSLVIFSVL